MDHYHVVWRGRCPSTRCCCLHSARELLDALTGCINVPYRLRHCGGRGGGNGVRVGIGVGIGVEMV